MINLIIFYGNCIVTVLWTVEHAVTKACDLKYVFKIEKSVPPARPVSA